MLLESIDFGGFNGAADFHRRKSGDNLVSSVPAQSASMGPPIFIGGNPQSP